VARSGIRLLLITCCPRFVVRFGDTTATAITKQKDEDQARRRVPRRSLPCARTR